MLRSAPLGLGLIFVMLSAGLVYAQGKPDTPPTNKDTPTLELKIEESDGKVTCAPAELRLPPDANVTLHIISHVNAPVIFTAPGQLVNDLVLHHDGDLGHVASGDGYTVKQNGKGVLKLRTLGAGEKEYGCASANKQSEPFKGKLIYTP